MYGMQDKCLESYCSQPNIMSSNLTENSTNLVTYLLYQYWIDKNDPRVENYWLFNGGPEGFAFLMLSWLLFVTKLGPYLMKDRNPLVLREVMMVYNLTLVIVNAFGIYFSIGWLDYGRKVLQLKLPDRSDTSEETLSEINEKMLIFYSKLLDLLDTVFFVLRKKSNQISFLHVYHHFIGNVNKIKVAYFTGLVKYYSTSTGLDDLQALHSKLCIWRFCIA